MTTQEFIENFNKYCEKGFDDVDEPLTIGSDFSIDKRIVIDEAGFVWLREQQSWKRIKTSVNVNNVIEFRRAEQECWGFYIICSDDTGFNICSEGPVADPYMEIYYYLDGKPSGWGTAIEHFKRFPVE